MAPSQVRLWFFFLVLNVLSARSPALAEPTQSDPQPSRLYMSISSGLGYNRYWQLGYADRGFEGLSVDLAVSIGALLSEYFAVGGVLGTATYPIGTVHDRISNIHYAPKVAIGGYIGPSIAVLPGGRDGRVRFDFNVCFGGSGASLDWGGIGAVVNIAPSWVLVSSERLHVGLHAKILYAQLFFEDGAAFRPLIGASFGPDISLY